MNNGMSRRVPQLVIALVAVFSLVAILITTIGDDGPEASEAPTSASESTPIPEDTPTSETVPPQPDATNPASTTAPSTTAPVEQLEPGAEAERAARRFLDTYVDDDGRVRRDADGDTVSEGQAYAMLLALAIDDVDTFDDVWTWTQDNLISSTGTLSWQWKDGEVLDANAASDADLDAARALFTAADRFGRPDYRDDANALAAALFDEDVVYAGDTTMLVAGPWAARSPYTWNPSYLAPAAFDLLAAETLNPEWTEIRRDAVTSLAAITRDGDRLPSDWATLGLDGDVEVSGAPGGGAVAFGYDGFRTFQRLAEACDADSLALAIELRDDIDRAIEASAGRTDLDGAAQDDDDANPLFLLAAASAADAAGDDERANELADEAERMERESPSYYLGAWVALTRVLIDTDRLDVCNSLDAPPTTSEAPITTFEPTTVGTEAPNE